MAPQRPCTACRYLHNKCDPTECKVFVHAFPREREDSLTRFLTMKTYFKSASVVKKMLEDVPQSHMSGAVDSWLEEFEARVADLSLGIVKRFREQDQLIDRLRQCIQLQDNFIQRQHERLMQLAYRQQQQMVSTLNQWQLELNGIQQIAAGLQQVPAGQIHHDPASQLLPMQQPQVLQEIVQNQHVGYNLQHAPDHLQLTRQQHSSLLSQAPTVLQHPHYQSALQQRPLQLQQQRQHSLFQHQPLQYQPLYNEQHPFAMQGQRNHSSAVMHHDALSLHHHPVQVQQNPRPTAVPFGYTVQQQQQGMAVNPNLPGHQLAPYSHF